MAKLIYLMGASGSGKDTLLEQLKKNKTSDQMLPQKQNRILVAHRYITRDLTHQSENHIALSEEEFMFRKEAGLFALNWYANGHYYAIGNEVNEWINKDFDVIINGSRAHLPEAKKKFGDKLLVVCLVVSQDILKKRLTQRARETGEQIQMRLERAALYAKELPLYTHYIDNEGDIASSVEQLIALIRLVNTSTKGERVVFDD